MAKMDVSHLEVMASFEKAFKDKAEAELMLTIMGIMASMAGLPEHAELIQAEFSVDALQRLVWTHRITRTFDPVRKLWLYEVTRK